MKEIQLYVILQSCFFSFCILCFHKCFHSNVQAWRDYFQRNILVRIEWESYPRFHGSESSVTNQSNSAHASAHIANARHAAILPSLMFLSDFLRYLHGLSLPRSFRALLIYFLFFSSPFGLVRCVCLPRATITLFCLSLLVVRQFYAWIASIQTQL